MKKAGIVEKTKFVCAGFEAFGGGYRIVRRHESAD